MRKSIQNLAKALETVKQERESIISAILKMTENQKSLDEEYISVMESYK